jgi:WD40 repeat protein
MVGHLEGVLGIQGDPVEDFLSIQSKLTPGSCEWISRRADFIQWAQKEESDQSPRIFPLIGLPATGKTAVSSYVVSFLQWKFQQKSCQYHFFPSGDQIKRTGTYILRSIAFQIARVNSVFRSKLYELYETESVAFEHQKLLAIWEKIFQGILFKMDAGEPLFWVLDALDETDSPDLLLRLFNKFRSKTLIKIFVVSRPSASLPQMTISAEDTLGDIRTYVERTVQDTLMVDDQLQKEIVDKVLKAANGSFLWVSLCLEKLRMSWHTQDDIQKTITDMPLGMESMYSRMVDSVAEQPERSRNMAARILTWTTCSYRPLHLSELRAALELEFGSLVNLEGTIAQICGHLVRVHHSEVTPLHETVRAFLHDNLSTLSTSGPQGHEYLALTCIQYLSNDRWRNILTKASHGLSRTRGTKEERHRQVASLEDANPFFAYAASNWAFHVSKSNPNSPEVLSALANFLDRHCLSWINGIALSGKLHPIVHTAQYLKAYARKRAHIKSIEPPTSLRMENGKYLLFWAVDLIQLVGHFGTNLIQSPTAIYRRIPPFCPRESMIARASNKRGDKGLVSVVGLSKPNWDDCLARVIVSEDQNVSRVLSTEHHLVTLIAVKGTVVVWSTETFKEMGRMLHREFVTAIALNKSDTLLVTAGSHTVKTWKLSTMTEIYSVPRPFLSRTMAIAFGTEDTEALSARDNCTIVCFDLQTGCINWDFVAAGPEDEDRSCPRLMVFCPHQSYIAIGFSGKPVTVWGLGDKDKQPPRRCIVAKDRQKSASDVYATPLAICWEPEGTSFLVLYHNSTLVRWHILDGEQETFTHIRAREMTISEDGSLLLTSDYNGSISVWACPRFHLLYQLNQDDLVRDMTFSPDAQRFYDLRGSMCHVWEPDELVRADDVESDQMSLSGTSLVAEPIVHDDDDTRGHITALACDEAGAYFCCGKDDGSVAIHKMSDGNRVRKVYSHSLTVSVIALAWSPSGKYMVSADDSGRIVCKRLERKESKWAVFPVFDALRVDGSVNQFLFGKDEKTLLISTASIDIVYDLRAKQERCRRRCQEGFGKRWVTHPKDQSLIIAITPFDTYIFTWSTLEPLEMPRGHQRIPSISINELESREAETDDLPSPRPRGRQEPPDLVQWITLSTDRHHLIYSIQPNIHNLTLSKSAPRLGRLRISKLGLPDVGIPLREPIPDLPGSMRRIIGCVKDEIAFLDDDFHFCTWRIGTPAESAKWHFFVPRDWLSPLSLQLAKINGQGAFLCPKNGEVAIVRLNSEW